MTFLPAPAATQNPFGWPLPATDEWVYEVSPYAALTDPAEQVAERLTMLAHASYNHEVWGSRYNRYWDAFAERIRGSANQPTVVTWWDACIRSLKGVTLTYPPLRYEKTLLCRPTLLAATPVEDVDVLMVFRTQALDLRDRTQMWASERRQLRAEKRDLKADPDVA